jgi:hypothetical protein
MALNQQELERFNLLLKRKGATTTIPTQVSAPATAAQPSVLDRVRETVTDVVQGGKNVAEIASKTRQDIGGALDAATAPGPEAISPIRALAQAFGISAGGVAAAVGEIPKAAIKVALPEQSEQALRDGVSAAVQPIAESELAQMVAERYAQLDENQKRDIQSILGTVSLGTEILGAGLGKRAAGEIVDAADQALSARPRIVPPVEVPVRAATEVAGAVADTAAEATPGILSRVSSAASTAGGVIQNIARSAGRIPGNIATNVAEREAQRVAINQLPTQVARRAAENGIDIVDAAAASSISQANKAQKNAARRIYDAVRAYSSGKSRVDPAEEVGKTIVDRVKILDVNRRRVGEKLGEAANNLGNVDGPELNSRVFENLRNVNGLDGLTVDEKGILDFTNTALSTSLTAADRRVIQSAFRDAIKGGTGKSKHLLRQELFEAIDGAKRGSTPITETQDKALQAIRTGLSEVLETKNPQYRTLSNQYRRLVQPLGELRRFMRVHGETADDVLTAKAASYARRLSSASATGPELNAILQRMDDALGVRAKDAISTKDLQELYNLFERYYPISRPGGFKGQIEAANIPRDGRGLISQAVDAVTATAGQTATVRQKALEALMDEVLKASE